MARTNMSTAVRTACISWSSKDFKLAVPVLIIGVTAGTLKRGEKWKTDN
jgi:hypothetical protein